MWFFSTTPDKKSLKFLKRSQGTKPRLERLKQAASGMSATRDERMVKKGIRLVASLQKQATRVALYVARHNSKLQDQNLNSQLENAINDLSTYSQQFTKLELGAMERIAAKAPSAQQNAGSADQ